MFNFGQPLFMHGLKDIWQKALLSILLATSSCSIIQESDITSPDQLPTLKLTSFQIEQTTIRGGGTMTAILNYDSVQNLTDPSTGAKIVRKIEYSLPALNNLKMKLRSGTTTNTRVFITYTDTKKVYNVGVIQQDSVVELYRFRYNTSGQLKRIVTFINPAGDHLPVTVATSDSLFYDASNRITRIKRYVGATATTITINYGTGGNNSAFVSDFLNYSQQQGSCSNDNSDASLCSGYNASEGKQINISATEISGSLLQISLQDQRTNNGGAQPREADIYYFHPLMFLRNQITSGNHLLVIYMMDWWVIGAVATTNAVNNDEIVTLKYTYGL